VDAFDWAPDGKRLAFTGSAREHDALFYMHNDLYIADVHGGDLKNTPLLPGYNTGPLWSPDGRWIAFESEGGQVRYLAEGRVGLYDLKSGRLSYPAFDELGRTAGFRAPPSSWAPDSRSLLLRVPYQLSKQLFTLSIPEGRLRRFTQDDTRNFYGARYESSGRIDFLSDSFLEPPNIYSSPAKRFQPQQLTQIESDPGLKTVEMHQLAWQSRDGQWTIHGWLLLPHKRSGELPSLVVFADGGPRMISPDFRTGWQFPLHAFLANGVAVLVPNSRGRAGYGAGFQMTWESERNPGKGPLEDDLEGVDQAVKLGLVDPEHVALAGLSWGGYLAAYALTHTTRFKAIFVNEAVCLNMMDDGFEISDNPEWIKFAQQVGRGTPFDDDDSDRLRRLSPIYQTANAKTPALLEFGANSLVKDGYALFQGLRHFSVPSELISYPRSGHGASEPVLLYDAARRDLEWFAYWVLGKPTSRMLDKYGPPKISEWNPDPGQRASSLQ
jgi:dipeptidyl aminopeptidase/acylaminoacyl peptidase